MEEKATTTMSEVFLDAAYVIALTIANDQHHERAVLLSEQVEAAGTSIVTTQAVMLEIANALSKQRYRAMAIELLADMEEDTAIEIVPLSDDLYYRSFQLYRERPDKEWGLTDCISFIVMQDRNLTDALTADEHFQQAGFKALLKET